MEEATEGFFCPHENVAFEIAHDQVSGFNVHVASISAKCKACGIPMRFLGAPAGISACRPTANFDGSTVQLPMVPECVVPDTQFEAVYPMTVN